MNNGKDRINVNREKVIALAKSEKALRVEVKNLRKRLETLHAQRNRLVSHNMGLRREVNSKWDTIAKFRGLTLKFQQESAQHAEETRQAHLKINLFQVEIARMINEMDYLKSKDKAREEVLNQYRALNNPLRNGATYQAGGSGRFVALDPGSKNGDDEVRVIGHKVGPVIFIDEVQHFRSPSGWESEFIANVNRIGKLMSKLPKGPAVSASDKLAQYTKENNAANAARKKLLTKKRRK